ncbi:hypothetical protein JZ751_021566 [Albula glossodonta]|uniref:Uncharacterized protein n=1 Tax=Albula glossodonta TaxID=121402 RepID=A0A8T2NIG4_9TELE|nr:hypothetical protein JZ751_021566 [Albula glossodonta]
MSRLPASSDIITQHNILSRSLVPWRGDRSHKNDSGNLGETGLAACGPAESLRCGGGHQNNKDSRILWIKDSDHILTTGFNQMREREVRLWDSRKLGSSVALVSLGTSSGVGLVPERLAQRLKCLGPRTDPQQGGYSRVSFKYIMKSGER